MSDFGVRSDRQSELPEEPSGKFCFVATAVYGSINAPEVETLREFRDNFLSKYSSGRKFIKFYYSGVGERVASFVSNHTPSLVPLIRKGLDFVVNNYKLENKDLKTTKLT